MAVNDCEPLAHRDKAPPETQKSSVLKFS
jgi:hypothetical protein